MATATGSASNPFQLMQAIQSLMDNEGWTSLHSAPPVSFKGPLTARYWRFSFASATPNNTSSYRLGGIALRGTVGGSQLMTDTAKVSFSGTSTSNLENLLSATASQFWSVTPPRSSNKQALVIDYDFGTPTTVEEAVLIMPSSGEIYTPRRWSVLYSNDGLSWYVAATAPYIENPVNGATLTLDFSGAYLDSWHYSETATRYGMEQSALDPEGVLISAGSSAEATNYTAVVTNSIHVFQGLGYGAGKPVYLYMIPVENRNLGGSYIRMTSRGTYIDPMGKSMDEIHSVDNYQAPVLILPDGPFQYWLYLNSHRLIIITRDSNNSYNSAYLGFMSAYLNPDTYPDPSVVLATKYTDNTSVIFSNIGYISKPGYDTAFFRNLDKNGVRIRNRDGDVSSRGKFAGNSSLGFVWPDHFGHTRNTSDTLLSGWHPGGGAEYGVGISLSILNRIVTNAQGEVPAFPVQVVDRQYGAMGALTGVAAIPGRGIAPEQIIERDGEDWRVFPCGSNRDGEDWFIVKEV